MFFRKKPLEETDEFKQSVLLEQQKKAEIDILSAKIKELDKETKNLEMDTGVMDTMWNIAESGITCCRAIGLGCDENDKIIHRTTIEKCIDFLEDRKGRLKVNHRISTYIDTQLNRLISEKKKWGIESI
jgi:alpha-D-ribose 1-methylphosphonate 5-triphosphate diphosphatase PhnM